MSSSAIDVSVIIPALNAERHICDAVDSALQQIGVTVEVIVVDNGSTDRTAELVTQKYGPSVRVVSEPCLGLAFARNAGIRVACGKYFALLDADDIWLPEKLYRQIAALARAPEGALVFCHGYEFYDSDLTPQERSEIVCRSEPYAALLPSGFLAAGTTFRKIGDLPNVPAGEFIAWYGWGQSLGFQTIVLRDVLLRRRVHAHNMTRKANAMGGYALAAKWLMDRRRQAQ